MSIFTFTTMNYKLPLQNENKKKIKKFTQNSHSNEDVFFPLLNLKQEKNAFNKGSITYC